MEKRKITIHDLERFELAGNPKLSPDGKKVLYERTAVDSHEDDYVRHLMLADVDDGKDTRPFTSAGTQNFAAAWSFDGASVAFLSNRSSGTQVWVAPLAGGEPQQLTRFQRGVTDLCWSPDGSTLYCTVPTPYQGDVETFEPDLPVKEAKEWIEKDREKWNDTPKRFERLYYKSDGSGLSHHRVTQIVSVDVHSGQFTQLTHGSTSVSRVSPSPDGKQVAFIANRHPNHEVEWWHDYIYIIPSTGGEPQLFTDQISAEAVSWSPDGRYLAVLGSGDDLFKYWSARHTHLFLLDTQTQSVMQLSKGFPDTLRDTVLSDVHADSTDPSPVWSKDGKNIYTLCSREGRSEVVRFTVSKDVSLVKAETVIGGDRDIFGFSTDGQNRFVITYGTPTDPSRVVSLDISSDTAADRQERRVTEPMATTAVPPYPTNEIRLDSDNLWLSEVQVVPPRPYWFQSADDWYVQGWVIPPVGYEPGKKYPVILEIHGGPQLNYGYMMFHEMQWLAAQGYAIVFTNPRGSMSYGQEFVNAVRLHYGESDASDVLQGLDAALNQFDFLDASRVAVTGGSYGGFMTNWLVGHTDRFFAAVSQRSISNWFSFYGVSDIGPLFVESQLGVSSFDSQEDSSRLWEMSPLRYASAVKTPLLLIHSEQDLRCPIEQAEQFYTAIKRHGGDVELLRIPNASHGLSRNGKPKLRAERLSAIHSFIENHLPSPLS